VGHSHCWGPQNTGLGTWVMVMDVFIWRLCYWFVSETNESRTISLVIHHASRTAAHPQNNLVDGIFPIWLAFTQSFWHGIVQPLVLVRLVLDPGLLCVDLVHKSTMWRSCHAFISLLFAYVLSVIVAIAVRPHSLHCYTDLHYHFVDHSTLHVSWHWSSWPPLWTACCPILRLTVAAKANCSLKNKARKRQAYHLLSPRNHYGQCWWANTQNHHGMTCANPEVWEDH